MTKKEKALLQNTKAQIEVPSEVPYRYIVQMSLTKGELLALKNALELLPTPVSADVRDYLNNAITRANINFQRLTGLDQVLQYKGQRENFIRRIIMSEDNVYQTFLIHEEIQLITFGYEKEDWEPAIQAYMKRTGSNHTEARKTVIACVSALDSGETVISTGTTIARNAN